MKERQAWPSVLHLQSHGAEQCGQNAHLWRAHIDIAPTTRRLSADCLRNSQAILPSEDEELKLRKVK